MKTKKSNSFRPALLKAGRLAGALLLAAAPIHAAQPGPRALELAAGLPPSALKTKLQSCAQGPFYATQFSIAHRGAPLGYAEHTREGYAAAARMGAGVIECDVTFTEDLAFVCRHSQCDLHRTTNILQTNLHARCSAPFTAATAEAPASARCCTSDITLAEFRSLCGRPDQVDPSATTVDAYLSTRSNPVTGMASSCGTLMTHRESIALIDEAGLAFTPELKAPEVLMPFAGFDQQAFASRLLDDYIEAKIDPSRVFPQSFDLRDIEFWLRAYPEFARQAVYLDPRGRDPEFQPTLTGMQQLHASGVRILAPPMPMLLTVDETHRIQPSAYALLAREAGLQLITWTLESGRVDDPANWMYASVRSAVNTQPGMLEVLHVLARDVGIRGIFSDWPGTVTYYANCYGL